MKSKHIAPFVLPLAALFCVPAQASIVFEDTFDGYATASEFTQTWTADGNPQYYLDTTFGKTGNSVRLVSATSGNGTSDRWFHNLGSPVSGTDTRPLVFSFDMYLDPAGESNNWNGAYSAADVRGYFVRPNLGGYKQGTLVNLVGMGLTILGPNPWYTVRVMAGGSDNGWRPLNASGVPTRSSGWHRFESVMTSSKVEFYVDGILSGSQSVSFPGGINSVTIGTGYPSNGNVNWLDNIRLEITPEPASLLLLLVAAAAVRPRTRAH